jgi:hypothetical protein
MNFPNHDTPTGLNECPAKIYNHLTPSGSSKIRVICGKGLWVLDMVATWVN